MITVDAQPDTPSRAPRHRRRAAPLRAAPGHVGPTAAAGPAWLVPTLVMLLALVLALAPAGPAARAAPADRCSPGWVCGWTDPGYAGVASLVAHDMPRFPATTAYVGFNDGASVWNGGRTWRDGGGRTWGRCVTVYSGVGYTGKQLTVRPGQGVPRLPADFDAVRSGRFHVCRVS
ncbi:peptidase inhibitor family I36 protein [Streptomyces sp. NPDC057939]|uniref:peptidase inhibitor family I36 protein n=1 Tax=Streptomyces sp. NPDC057939 TaxID=3346284 RepID=UPI0036E16C3B